MTLALGIDIGTSGLRSAVMRGGELLSMARADHLKQNPDCMNAALWWQAVKNCLQVQVDNMKDQGLDPQDIRAIAVDGTSGSMVLADENFNPVSPALMYNSKGFNDEAEKIAAHVSGHHITKGSNSALARAMRLVSLAEKKPRHLFHQADFIAAKLMRQGGHSDFNNALKTGFDPESACWPAWIDQLIDPALLPKVHNPGHAIAPIDLQIADQFGLSRDAIIHAGTTDSVAAFLASAPIEERVAVTSLGSTLAIKLLSKQRVDDPSVGLYSHRLGKFWLVGGASNTGGAVLKAYFSKQEIEKLSAQINPDHPLDLGYYPLLTAGERFPVNDPQFAPKLQPRPEDDVLFLQAMLEGMAAIESKCYAAIIKRGGPAPSQIFTAGGGAHNIVWSKIRTRHLKQAPFIAPHNEAAIGVAKLCFADLETQKQ